MVECPAPDQAVLHARARLARNSPFQQKLRAAILKALHPRPMYSPSRVLMGETAMPDAPQRCELTNLETAMCAHCRVAPVPRTPSGSQAADGAVWFHANHPGTCAGCGTEYDAGTPICKAVHSGWIAACCFSPSAADQILTRQVPQDNGNPFAWD